MADDPGDRAAEPTTHLPTGAGVPTVPPESPGSEDVTAARRGAVAAPIVRLHRRPGLRHTLRRPDSAPADDEPTGYGGPDTSRGAELVGAAAHASRPIHTAAVAPPARVVAATPAPPPAPSRTSHRTASRTTSPTASPTARAGAGRDEPDLAWAATSTLIAGVRARLVSRRRPWTWVRVLRAATATTALVVVLLLGVAWGATSWVQAAIRQIGALDPDSSSIVDAAAQVGDQNYLVIGSDTRVGATPDEAVGDESGIPGARSDTVMVIHVPADRSAVTAVSFPRDLEIDRPACERWDSTTGAYLGVFTPAQGRAKLNTAYQVGGPRCVTKVVQGLSGLAINHFLGVDFAGFKGMVDAVGGVPLCLDRPLHDAVLGDVVDRAGPTVLTGDQALGFVRARHVEGDPTSDYGRIQRQQRFLSALLREVLSAGTLFDIGKLRGLANAVSASTFGENIGSDQLLALGRSLGGIDTHNVVFTTVPTTGVANARGNEVLRAAENSELFHAVIDRQPLPGAPGGPAPAVTTVSPQQVTVRLVEGRSSATGGNDDGQSEGRGSSDGSGDGDGTGDGGGDDGYSGFRHTVAAAPAAASASEVASSLRARGFTVVVADGRPTTGTPGASASSPTVIRFSPDEQAAAATLARAVPGATLLPYAGAGLLDLVVGDGFDGRIVDPTVVAAPVAPAVTAADTACS